jgi:hypothetical protein
MKVRPIQVELRYAGVKVGTMVDAQLVICPECEGEGFTIYFLDEHQHIQCLSCNTTFCGKAEKCAAGIEQ